MASTNAHAYAQRLAERFSLIGRVALIGGGSRGIGRAIALAFAEAGADVAVVGRTLDALDSTVKDIRTMGTQALGLAADIGLAEDRERVVGETIERFGRVDVLVNNAAAQPSLGPLMEVPEEVWDRLMEVNVKAYMVLTRLAVADMLQRGWGRIINVTSSTGLKARPGMGEYAVTKAAEIMLTRSFAVELGQAGITVNAIAPILTKTDFSERQWTDPNETERVVSMQAIKRLGRPEDVVGAALLLASDAGSFITGTTIVVDGGALA
ncbi:MAG TPA: glucose 1-dehydrogenase [Rubrobacteraceae bacterium]|nr:glucose 1-dehydrogenase [Rubrobacteraceae bacterium]